MSHTLPALELSISRQPPSNGRVDRLLYDGFFSFAVVRQLVPFAFILTSNPHRNVTDTRCFDRIMG